MPPYVGPHPCPGAEYHATVGGSPSGDGSLAKPWDLATALAAPASLKAGDTIWIHGGIYGGGGSTTFSSVVKGTAQSPICVRQFPGDRAILDGALVVYGSYAWYWGFEIQNSNWERVGGSGGQDGVIFDDTTASTAGNKLVNMTIHDVVDGIADQRGSTASESYGNVIYNIGYSATDRGHGHHLYLQNAMSDVKLARENIGYNAFDIGVQEYGVASPVSHIHLEGNVTFNSGLPYGHRTDNVIVSGGSEPKSDIRIDQQIAYNPLDATSDNTGYNILGSGEGIDLEVTNGIWVGATPTGYLTLQIQGWQSLKFEGNTVIGPIQVNNVGGNAWTGNTYYKSTPPAGLDPGGAIHDQNPTGVTVFVRPNFYELGRANIVVLNWDKKPTVDVDISMIGLAPGAKFEVRDVQNFFGTPALAGTYAGTPITLPMTLSDVTPIANYSPTPPHTSAEFGAFVLLPIR